ncbi:aspartyl protease family protein [Chitinophagaceae bacterium LWZ2-11]
MKRISLRKTGVFGILSLTALFTGTYVHAQIATFKIEKYYNQVWLKAGLGNNTRDSLLFLFDSGAGTALLDSAVAAKLFPDKHYNQTSAMGASGSASMKLLHNESIYFNQFKLDSVNFLVNDLSRLSATLGRKLDGIIGYNLIKKYVTRIDLDAGTISIYKDIRDVKGSLGKPLTFGFSPEIPFLPRVKCSFTTVTGQTYTGYFFFDSGAGMTAMLNTPFVNANQLLTKAGKTLRLKSEGLTNSSDRYVARVASFNFSGETFKDLPISMTQTTTGVNAMGGEYAGLLGNEFLYRYNLTLDYTHNAIYLQPNKYYADKFDFPLCGFALKTSNGRNYIATVSSESPEYAQGLKEGDEIIKVNGKAGLAIADIRELLKHEGQITLRVKQNTGEKEFVVSLYPRV